VPLIAATDPERAARRREWMSRALFEAALILFGILGAFAVNEWQNARERRARVETTMAAVRGELQSNLELLQNASTYNSDVASKFRALAARNATTIPEGTYPRGLLLRPQLVSAAWNAAQVTGIVNEVPVDTVVQLARLYENQRDYLDAMARLLDMLYEAALRSTDDTPAPPNTIDGILSDYAGRERSLLDRYRSTLARLDHAGR
jgi:type II secretory pathway pseudopilin PulG